MNKSYLISAYYSEFVEAATEQEAKDKFRDILAGIKLGEFEVEVHDSEVLP